MLCVDGQARTQPSNAPSSIQRSGRVAQAPRNESGIMKMPSHCHCLHWLHRVRRVERGI